MDTKYVLKLYIAGTTPNNLQLINNLKMILEKELKGIYEWEIIDVLKDPKFAENDKILATPTLVRVLPLPARRIVGDLSDMERAISMLI